MANGFFGAPLNFVSEAVASLTLSGSGYSRNAKILWWIAEGRIEDWEVMQLLLLEESVAFATSVQSAGSPHRHIFYLNWPCEDIGASGVCRTLHTYR